MDKKKASESAKAKRMSKKGVAGAAVTMAVVVGVGAGAGLAIADDSYAPTVLGNDAYTNQVDVRNDYTVEAVNYTSPISDQNSESVADARALSTVIGQESDDASPIIVTNSLGKEIKELSIRTSDEASYPSNMMSGTLSDGGQAVWYLTYDYAEQDYTNSVGATYKMPVNYLIKATLADGTTAEFHNVNMNGVRTLNLCYSDDYGVNYVERTTITNHTPDPNLYYEANLASYANGIDEFNYHVNSGGALTERMITESRGGAWRYAGHDPLPDIEDYGIDTPLLGEPSGDYTDDLYNSLYWNADGLTWR